jgi:aromatic-L-amino-acid decarboxylase
MLWRTSPAATELEQLTMDWLRQMIGLPPDFFGIIGDTVSSNTLYALAATRELHPELRLREEGMSGRADLPKLVVYCSEEAHSSVAKAVMTLGLGLDSLHKISTDRALRMDPHALSSAVENDLRAGRIPLAAVATNPSASSPLAFPPQAAPMM